MNVFLISLIIALIIQSLLHHYERKDLYNRIMCKSIHEYKNDKYPSAISKHDKVLKKWRGEE